MSDRRILEKHFQMEAGYVLNFSDHTIGQFVSEAIDRDIHD